MGDADDETVQRIEADVRDQRGSRLPTGGLVAYTVLIKIVPDPWRRAHPLPLL